MNHPLPAQRPPFKRNRLLQLYLLLTIAAWLYAWWQNIDPPNFYVDSIVVVVLLLLLTLTYRGFRFSNGSYTCFLLFILLHIYGAQYAYTGHPVGFWLQETFHLNRNPYDRIVHFALGFLLVLPARDFILHHLGIGGRVAWVWPAEMMLAIAAFFELAEWIVGDVLGGGGFVATQGDGWDSQKDIALAFIGAVLMLVLARMFGKKSQFDNSSI